MALIEEQIKTGNWLFKHRSYLPVVLFILYYIGLIQDVKSIHLFQNDTWLIICFLVSLLGQLIRIITVAKVPMDTSGRNTKKQKAGSVNKLGIYSILRHPLYLGNYFMWLGMFLLIPILWVHIIFSLMYWLYYERIMIAEEEFLRGKFGNEYTDWAEGVSAFIPSFKNYKKNAQSINFKNIIKREYTSLSAMIILFIVLININNWLYLENWNVGYSSKLSLLIIIIFYVVMRLLKKKTTIFK